MRKPAETFETTAALICRLQRENEALWLWVCNLQAEKELLKMERDQTWTSRLLNWRDNHTE